MFGRLFSVNDSDQDGRRERWERIKAQARCEKLTQSAINAAIKNIKSFSTLFADFDDLSYAAENFPEYSCVLSCFAVSKPYFTQSTRALVKLIEIFPDIQSFLYKRITTLDREAYDKLVNWPDNLVDMAKAFPDHRGEFIKPVLEDPALRARMIATVSDLTGFAKAFPEHQAELIGIILTNVEMRTRLLNKVEDFIHIGKEFAEYQTQLINLIQTENILCARLIKNSQDFAKMGLVFSGHHDKLIHIVQSGVKERKRIFKNLSDYVRVGKVYTDHQAVLLKPLLKNKTERMGVIDSAFSLDTMIGCYPMMKDALIRCYSDNDLINFISSTTAVCKLVNIFSGDENRILRLVVIHEPEFLFYVVFSAMEKEKNFTNASYIERYIAILEDSAEGNACARNQLGRLEHEFKRSNNRLTQYQQKEYHKTFFKYRDVVSRLMVVVGAKNALSYLATLASVSVLRLDRFLKNYEKEKLSREVTSLSRFLINKYTESLEDKSHSETWGNVLIHLNSLNALVNADGKYGHDVGKFQAEMSEADTLPDVLNNLSDYLMALELKRLGGSVSAHEVNQGKIKRIRQSRYFSKLLCESRKLNRDGQNDTHSGWYNAMLACDLTNRSFESATHDLSQENKCERLIAEHNANVRKILTASGVDADKAINYQPTHRFTYVEKVKISSLIWKKTGDSIIFELKNLFEYLSSDCAEKELDPIARKHLLKKSEIIITQMTKGKNADTDIVKRVKSPVLFDLIMKLYDWIPKSTGYHSLVDNKFIFIKPAIESLMRYKNAIKPKSFRVEQWDKSRVDTYFLGNYLDCCLGASGRSFAAMIERRLDDAMPIHVVMDEETNEPVCGAWLFFAEDASKGNQITLVANYLELSNQYSKDTALLDTLLANLLYFTGEMYIKDVGVPSLVMRELAYGNIYERASGLSGFGFTSCEFKEKLGGFCQSEFGKVEYYLVSLEQQHFHLYSHKGACQTQTFTPARRATQK